METRKAVENFPVSGEPIPPPVARWLGRIKAAAARVNAELGLLDADKAERIAAAADRVASGRARRPVPDRRLPDRLGHLVEHERERGDRGARRRRRPRERRRQHGPVLERRLPDGRAPRRARRDRARPAAGARAARRGARGARREEFDDVVKSGRTHWMDAVPGHARPGVRRLRGAGARGDRARARHAAAARQGAARRHGRRHRPEHASRSSPRACARDCTRRPGSTISPPADAFESQAARDGDRRGLGRAEGRWPSR